MKPKTEGLQNSFKTHGSFIVSWRSLNLLPPKKVILVWFFDVFLPAFFQASDRAKGALETLERRVARCEHDVKEGGAGACGFKNG